MWKKTYTIVTNEVSAYQIWNLFADVNNWHNWDEEIEYARMKGGFKKGTRFILKPKGGPKVNIELIEVKEPTGFTDVTFFLFAKMYDEHLFEETPQGLKITNTITVTGLLSFLWVRLVAKKLVKELPVSVQNQIQAAKPLKQP